MNPDRGHYTKRQKSYAKGIWSTLFDLLEDRRQLCFSSASCIVATSFPTQFLSHELRTSDIQSSMSKRSSSDVSAVCLKPRTALTSKCAALCAVQEFFVKLALAIGLRNLSTAFSNLRYPLLRD